MAANSPSSKQRSYKQTNALVVLLVFPLLTAYFTPNGRAQPPNGLGQKGRGILSQLVEALHILGQNTPSLLSQSPPHAREKEGASVRMERPHGRKGRQEGHFSPETGTVGTDAPGFRRTTDVGLPTLPDSRAVGARRASFLPKRTGRIRTSPHFGTKYPVPFVPGRPRGRGARS